MAKTHVIDGVTYVEVDRKAEVGERIIVTERWCNVNVGEILDVISGEDFGFLEKYGQVYHAHPDNNRGMIKRIEDDYYSVLEPLSTEASPDVTDLLANLARRVASLEEQLRSTQRNLETTAEELANARHRLAKYADRFAAVESKVEMLIDDMVDMDERSQVLNAINKYYAEGMR